MPAAMTLISSQTLGSAVTSVTFNSFSGYRDLYFVIRADMTSGAEQMRMTFNSDTNYGNYSGIGMAGEASATSATWSGTTGYGEGARIQYKAYQLAGTPVVTLINVLDYSATDKHKTSLIRANRPSGAVDANAVRWASTSAVTSVVFDMYSSTFTAGSTFYLYGVAS